MEFRRFRQFAALGLRYAALNHGQADVVNAYATDWQIATYGFTTSATTASLAALPARRRGPAAGPAGLPGLTPPILASAPGSTTA
jgi:osmoprotectant transport system substrate-binding protein